jgi:methionyl-tRNA formyltransferase
MTEFPMKNVLLLGKGELAIFAAEILRSLKCDVLTVIPVKPEPTWTPSLSDWAKENNCPQIDYREISNLPEGFFDLGLSIYYDKILKKQDLEKFQRILNMHNSLLPKYRGVRPVNWALKNNESRHGVTLHEMTPQVDQGPIIAQVEFSIFPDIEEVEEVYARCISVAKIILQEYLPNLNKIAPQEQDDSKATYYSEATINSLGERFDLRRNISNS